MRDVISLAQYVTDIEAFMSAGDIRRQFFSEPYPVTTTVQITRLYHLDLVVEIAAIADIREIASSSQRDGRRCPLKVTGAEFRMPASARRTTSRAARAVRLAPRLTGAGRASLTAQAEPTGEQTRWIDVPAL
jgi:hypothetical protein